MTIVTVARPDHTLAIAVLAEEMDRFYEADDIPSSDVRIGQIREALFSDPPAAYALLAWNDQNLVGMASYSFLWPAVGLTRSLYLKELFVTSSARRSGIGRLLMHNILETAAKYGCSRVDWTTDRCSRDTDDFYASLELDVDDSKVFYRVEGEQGLLRAIARTASGNG